MNLLRIGRNWILPLQATGTNLLQILPDQDPTCRGYRYVFITDSAGSGSYLYRIPVCIYYGFDQIRILPLPATGTN
jgi:hypothetical protein